VLFWCPIGASNAQDAPIATAIRKLSGFTPKVAAIPMAIGQRTAAVAAVFITSDRQRHRSKKINASGGDIWARKMGKRQRISTTGTLQARIIAVVVDPITRLRIRLCP
jgi:hypothetical protein